MPSKRVGRLPREWAIAPGQVQGEEDYKGRLGCDGRRGDCAFRQWVGTSGQNSSPFSENRTYSPIRGLLHPDALRTNRALGEGSKPSGSALRPNCWHFELHTLLTGRRGEQSGLNMITGERSPSTTVAGTAFFSIGRLTRLLRQSAAHTKGGKSLTCRRPLIKSQCEIHSVPACRPAA